VSFGYRTTPWKLGSAKSATERLRSERLSGFQVGDVTSPFSRRYHLLMPREPTSQALLLLILLLCLLVAVFGYLYYHLAGNG